MNLAPGEGAIPISPFYSPKWEASAFPVLFPTGKNTFDETRQVKISVRKYANVRLLSKDSRFAESTEYTFHCLHWLETTAIRETLAISTQKYRQADLTAGQLVNKDRIQSLFK